MRNVFKTAVSLLLIACSWQNAIGQQRVFTIGNSLTQDMIPQWLTESQWHIYCSKNLDYIYNHPNGHCVASSTTWPEAFQNYQFDFVTVQPFQGTNLQQDRDIIAVWMQMQPSATFVIHSGWTQSSTFPDDFQAGNPDDTMRPSPEYMNDLIQELKSLFPSRQIIQTHANEILFSIWQDIEANSHVVKAEFQIDTLVDSDSLSVINPYENFTGDFQVTGEINTCTLPECIPLPFDAFTDLYRDFIHMNLRTGRYLMHNALRYAVGQTLFERENYHNTTLEEFRYLEHKILSELVIRGDINRDRHVDLLDIDSFTDILIEGRFDITADMNGDKSVDLLDISLFIDAVLIGM